MLNFLKGHFNQLTAEEADKRALKNVSRQNTPSQNKKKNRRIMFEGVGNLMHHIARCCQPILGDEIVGFITQGRGISIHKAYCPQLIKLRSRCAERIVEAVWDESYSSGYCSPGNGAGSQWFIA